MGAEECQIVNFEGSQSRLDFVPCSINHVDRESGAILVGCNVQQILGCHAIIVRFLTHRYAEVHETKTRVGRIEKLGRCYKERTMSQAECVWIHE